MELEETPHPGFEIEKIECAQSFAVGDEQDRADRRLEAIEKKIHGDQGRGAFKTPV